MKISKLVVTIIAIIVIELLSFTKVLAEYKTTSVSNSTVQYNAIIHLTNSKELENEEGRKYIKVTSMDDLKKKFVDNSIIMIENDMIEKIDTNWIKNVLKEKNTTLLIGYEDLATEVEKSNSVINISELANKYIEEKSKLTMFAENSYYKVRVEYNDNLVYGQFLIKAKDVERLLKDVNESEGRQEIAKEENTAVDNLQKQEQQQATKLDFFRDKAKDNLVIKYIVNIMQILNMNYTDKPVVDMDGIIINELN